MATEIWVNIGSGNGLLPDGTMPLPEPMLTDHLWSSVAFISVQFHKTCLNHQSLKSVWKLQHKISFKFPRGQWVKHCYNVRFQYLEHQLPCEHLTHWGLVTPYGDKRSWSTLAQVMACCLTAPSHYLNQCWLIISTVKWHSSKGKFTRDTSAINHWKYLEN